MRCVAPSSFAFVSLASEEEVTMTVAPDATASWRAKLEECRLVDQNEGQADVHGDTAGALDKDEVASFDGDRSVQRVPGGHGCARQGRSLLERQVTWDSHKALQSTSMRDLRKTTTSTHIVGKCLVLRQDAMYGTTLHCALDCGVCFTGDEV